MNATDKLFGAVDIGIGLVWAASALSEQPGVFTFMAICAGFLFALGIAHFDRARRVKP